MNKRRFGILLRAVRPGVPSPRRTPKRLIIAIDGPAGSGKSSTAKVLAARLRLPYIDTGAMYRSVTWKAIQKGTDLRDLKALVRIAKTIRIAFRAGRTQKVIVDGKDVTKAIRQPELTRNVVYIAREPKIRVEMVKMQRRMGRMHGAVMDGRDIGSVVFPNTPYKFYFDADPELRALRRQRELAAAGKKVAFKKVLQEIHERDRTDRERKTGALKVAKGAIVIDTTELTIPQTIDKILGFLKGRSC